MLAWFQIAKSRLLARQVLQKLRGLIIATFGQEMHGIQIQALAVGDLIILYGVAVGTANIDCRCPLII